MLTLYLARHGETVWNTQSRMQGQQDSPLTTMGREQARQLAQKLSSVQLNSIYTSPAPRAADTAKIIQSSQTRFVPLVEEPRIHEMALGQLEGLTVDEAMALDPENLNAFFYAPDRFKPFPGGEDFSQVSRRMAEFLQDLSASTHQNGRRKAVITHNITLKALFALIENRPLAMLRDGPPIQQAKLYIATFNGTWQLESPGEP